MCKSHKGKIRTDSDNTQSYSGNTWSKDDEKTEKEEKDFRFLALKVSQKKMNVLQKLIKDLDKKVKWKSSDCSFTWVKNFKTWKKIIEQENWKLEKKKKEIG